MQKAPKSLWNANYLFLILVNFFVSISYSMVAMVISQYAVSMGMSVALAGSLTGAFSIASMVVRPITGYINDHCEHRNLLMLATVGMGIASLFYGFTDSPVVLMALRLLHGAAFAFSSTVNMAVIPSLVPSNRITEGLSYYGIVQSVGVALGPSLGIAIIGDGQYQLNFILSSLIALAAAALVFLLPKMTCQPSSGIRHIRLGDIFAKECVLYAFIDVAIASANGLETSLISLYGAQQHIANIGLYFTVSAVVLCIARLMLGKLADKKGVAFALYPGLALIIGGFFILWRAHTLAAFLTASVIKTVGIALARPAIQAACLKAVPPHRRGSASSTYYIGSDIGQGTSPIIGGSIVDMTGNADYGAAFAWYTLPLFLGAGAFALWNRKSRAPQQQGG